MHLRQLAITNFRSISNLDLSFTSGANLIVGPNAVGKTTVLEAIRLAKAALAPRTQQETRNVLISLGVVSPALPQGFNYTAIASDISKPITINCTFELTKDEIYRLPGLTEQLARQVVGAQFGISADNGPFAFIQLFSTPQGQASLNTARQEVIKGIAAIASSKECKLHLSISPDAGLQGTDGFSQLLYSTLENDLAPIHTRFSYFPADRALPPGEAQILLGSADAQQQMESHNSTPAQKYNRLKTSIFASFMEGPESRAKQELAFKSIFEKLLKEKSLQSFSINAHGQASILIQDHASGKVYDIDAMSSGEKGLILTFLIISRTLQHGGVILLDEPELHLNSAVCKDLLDFLLDEYLKPNDLQAIICTHSPEIMSSAMRRDECMVYHLRRGTQGSVIRKQDQPEAVQALKLLGTSEIEELLYEAVIFVEGDDDVELLESAFQETLSKFRFRPLGGRPEVEKHIVELQKLEKAGLKENVSYFIFDGDNKMSELVSTSKVVVKQWDKYCLENYLLDVDVLYDLVRREFTVRQWPKSVGEAAQFFQNVAYKQLMPSVIEETYNHFEFESLGLRGMDKKAMSFAAAASLLYSRIGYLQEQILPLDETGWSSLFVTQCESLHMKRQ